MSASGKDIPQLGIIGASEFRCKINHVHCLHNIEIGLPRYYDDAHPGSMMHILISLYAMGSQPAC